MSDYSTRHNLPAPLTIDDFDITSKSPVNLKSDDCTIVLFYRKGDRASMSYFSVFRRASVDSGPKYRTMDFSDDLNTELLNLFSNQAQYNSTGSAFAYGAVRTPTIISYQKGKPVGFFNTTHSTRRGTEFSAEDLITYSNNLACRADYYEPFQQKRTSRVANNVRVITPRSPGRKRAQAYERPYSVQLNEGTPVGLTQEQIKAIQNGEPGPSVTDRSTLAPTEMSASGELPLGSGTESSPSSAQIASEMTDQRDSLTPPSSSSVPVLGSSSSYSVPAPVYSAPAQAYSVPAPVYSAPAQSYSVPAPVYSAPTQSYSAPAQSYSAPPAGSSFFGTSSATPEAYRSLPSAPTTSYQVSPLNGYPSYPGPSAYTYPYPGQTTSTPILQRSYSSAPPSGYTVIGPATTQSTSGWTSISAGSNPNR